MPLVTTTRDSWGSLTLSNSWSWNSEEREKKKTKPLVCSNLNKKALRSNTILTTVDKNSPCSSFNRLIYFSIITSSRSQYLKNTRSVLHCKLQWTHNKKTKENMDVITGYFFCTYTINGSFPPSSKVTGVRFSEAAAMTCKSMSQFII